MIFNAQQTPQINYRLPRRDRLRLSQHFASAEVAAFPSFESCRSPRLPQSTEDLKEQQAVVWKPGIQGQLLLGEWEFDWDRIDPIDSLQNCN
jgi:hypothetical protein